jgi:hypothetical protein
MYWHLRRTVYMDVEQCTNQRFNYTLLCCLHFVCCVKHHFRKRLHQIFTFISCWSTFTRRLTRKWYNVQKACIEESYKLLKFGISDAAYYYYYYWQKSSQFKASCKDSKKLQESWTYKTAKNLFKDSPCTVMKCWCP